MSPPAQSRLVILTEGQFGIHTAKAAVGVIRYGPPEALLIGIAPTGGRLPVA